MPLGGAESGCNVTEKKSERNLADVIAAILPILREHRPLVAMQVQHIRESISYRAPEDAHIDWRKLADVLTRELPKPPGAEAWAQQISDIMQGRAEVSPAAKP